MIKKIIYGVIGIFVFFVLIAIIVPSSEPETIQEKKEDVVVENIDTTTSTEPTNIESDDESYSQIADTNQQEQPTSVPTTPITQTNPQYEYYSVSNVVDGDTIKVNISGTVETLRLIGMDTPETVDPRKPVQCFGMEASNKAKELLNGRKVRIEKDPMTGEIDKYGRKLAYIYRDDGLFFNKHMIEQGYAHEYTYNTPYKYQTEFKAAQKSAQENLRGLWSPDTCNGDTTSEISDPTPSPIDTTDQSAGNYYTSSYHTATYYYPAECDGWKSLSEKYLESYDSLEDLLQVYPSKTLSPQCQ